jgi:hypothetical protein
LIIHQANPDAVNRHLYHAMPPLDCLFYTHNPNQSMSTSQLFRLKKIGFFVDCHKFSDTK